MCKLVSTKGVLYSCLRIAQHNGVIEETHPLQVSVNIAYYLPGYSLIESQSSDWSLSLYFLMSGIESGSEYCVPDKARTGRGWHFAGKNLKGLDNIFPDVYRLMCLIP